ncbi:MAG: AEC family transporter [Hyphomicrobium sp.]
MHTVLNAALPVFGLMLLGFLAGRSGRFEASATDTLNRFAFYFALPALIFIAMAKAAPEQLRQLNFLAAFAGSVAVTWIVGYAISRRKGQPAADALIDGCNAGYSNVGFMGVPLCLLVFGREGIAPAAMSVLLTACVQFLLAIILVELVLKGGENLRHAIRPVLASLIRNPLFIAPLAGITASVAGLTVPSPLEQFALLLGNAAAPTALFCIGLSLAQTKLASHDYSAIAWLTALKLLLQPAIAAVLVVYVFSMPKMWAQAAVLLSALPIGSGIFTIAKTYERDTGVTSGAIMTSHVFSVLSLTFLIAWMV